MTIPRERTLIGAVRELLSHSTPTRRRHLRYVLVLMILGAFAELATIGALLPFLTLLSDPDRARQLGLIRFFFDFVGASSHRDVVLTAATLFAITAIAAGAIRLMLSWSSQAFVFWFGHEIGVDLQRRVLHQPYTYHVMKNSSEILGALEKVNALVFSVILPAMVAFSSIVMSVFIIGALLLVDWKVALVSATIFSIIYLLISRLTEIELSRNAQVINQSYAQRIQVAQESSGAIRDILLDDAQPEYLRKFSRIDRRLRQSQIINSFIGAAPRFIMEATGMILIAFLAFALAGREGGIAAAIPILGALALGAQRLLPLVQQVYYGWAQIKGHEGVLGDVLDLLRLPVPDRCQQTPRPLGTDREIQLRNVEYRYPGREEPVLRDITLTIPAGTRIALIGKTGSGKSTLIDLMLGLLEPTSGEILVDGTPLIGDRLRVWQASIAHVPQSIFLSDTTLASNIAFGVPPNEVDMDRVQHAAEQAQLHTFVESLPNGYETRVGERGIQLSGGQRQRLGIARALYKSSGVLVLDEATSALDEETEARVIQSLDRLDQSLTVIMIAHRLSTIACCDTVVRLDNGRIVEIGSYDTVIRPSHSQSA